MDFVTELLQQYGYPILFALGLVEFLGAPVASGAALMVVGAFAVQGAINPVAAIAAVAFGALVGESTWFSVARWRGKRLIDLACGLASNPRMCVVSFAQRLRRSGPAVLIIAKFLPAGGSVPAFAAGLVGTPYRRFLLFDGIAVLLWSTFYVLAGGIFQEEVHAIVEWAASRATWIMSALVVLFVVALVWRVIKTKRHRVFHAAHVSD
jgi:membrane protein DedA with SNARE-associated domain